MKITRTIKMPDGTTKTESRDDGRDPAKMLKVKNEQRTQSQGMQQQGSYMDQLRQKIGGNPVNRAASMGRGGDTQLAHVNPQEADLLKRLGGSGTKNPRTGLREFYTNEDISSWYTQSLGREPDQGGLTYWQQQAQAGVPDSQLWNAFQNAATAAGETSTGWAPGTTYVAPQSTTPAKPMFDIPLNIMPTESSSSSSYSGLPSQYQEQLLSSVMPQLTSAVTNMPGNIDSYTNEALSSYQQMMQNALSTNMPNAISGLANRGILNSTEGQNVMSRVMSDAARDASTKGYQTAMQSALLKANMPTVLAQIADLGRSQTSQSTGESSDPTVMYRKMSDMIMQMMG